MSNLKRVPNVIIMYAYRYGMGRQTGAVIDAIECIKDNIANFKEWELNSMIDEYVDFSKLLSLRGEQVPHKRDLDQFMLYLNEILMMREMINDGR